jgi:ATP diphosphatase
MEAHKISSKAARVGFDWPGVEGILEKLTEETRELQEHLARFPAGTLQENGERISSEMHSLLEEEVGDLFFVLVNLARHLDVDPESALRKTNRKFRRRFGFVEEQLTKQGGKLEDASLEQMEALWQQVKSQEKQR